MGIEFHSLSKTYNMTGWRIGFAAGNKDVIAGLGKIKSNLDSGVFQAIQEAAIAAFNTDDSILSDIRKKTYQDRRDTLALQWFKGIGFHLIKPKATFYLWARKCLQDLILQVSLLIFLIRQGVLATPGNGFGAPGEGICQVCAHSACGEDKETVERIKKRYSVKRCAL